MTRPYDNSYDELIIAGEAALHGFTKKDDLEKALRGAVTAARHYRTLAEEAAPIMDTIKRMISDQIEDRD